MAKSKIFESAVVSIRSYFEPLANCGGYSCHNCGARIKNSAYHNGNHLFCYKCGARMNGRAYTEDELRLLYDAYDTVAKMVEPDVPQSIVMSFNCGGDDTELVLVIGKSCTNVYIAVRNAAGGGARYVEKISGREDIPRSLTRAINFVDFTVFKF